MREAVNSITHRTEGLSLRATQSIEELQYQIQDIELQSPQHTELTILRTELIKSRQQNQLYQHKITELTTINQRQSGLIAKYSPNSVSSRLSKESSPVQQERIQRPKAGSLFDRSRNTGLGSSSNDSGKSLSSSLPTKFGGAN